MRFHFVMATLLTFQTAYASTDLSGYLKTIKELKVSKEQVETLELLEKKNPVPKTMAEFCPMNSSDASKETVESLRALAKVFESDCFDNDQSLVTKLLDSSKELENELSEIEKEKGEDVAKKNEVKTLSEVEVDGIPVAELVNGISSGINELFGNKCSDLDKETFLVRSANVIQTFSQIGLYSESGATYAFGGLAVSSILRFIDSILNGRFEFKTAAEINTFKKLNCSFYDIRRQIEKMELYAVEDSEHYKDAIVSTSLKKELVEQLEEYTKALEELQKGLEKKKTEYIKEVASNLEKVVLPIAQKLPEVISDQPGFSANAQKAQVLDALLLNKELLLEVLEPYLLIQPDKISFTNKMFSDSIAKLDDPMSLYQLDEKEFNKKFYNDLKTSFNRVLSDIKKMKEQDAKDFANVDVAVISGTSLTSKEVMDYLKGKEFKKVEENFFKLFDRASNIDDRLNTFTTKNRYSAKDSHTNGLLEIIELDDKATNYTYGDFGEKFIKSMTKRAKSQNENFFDRFDEIEEKYFGIRDEKYLMRYPVDHFDKDTLASLCIDIDALNKVWNYSHVLSELGYDFLVTNQDIFGDHEGVRDREDIIKHLDSTILARRIISAKNFEKKLKNYRNLGKETMVVRGKELPLDRAQEEINKIQFYKKTMTIKEAEKYLKDEYSRYHGPVMVAIDDNKDRASFLARTYEEYSCDTARIRLN